MANVTVTTSTSNVNVNSTTNEVSVSSTTSNIVVGTIATVSNADVRAAISNIAPILYNSTTGVISIDQNAILSETFIDSGNIAGNISLDLNQGKNFRGVLTADITGITLANVENGDSVTLVVEQNVIGGHNIDTTTHATNWTDFAFVNGFSTLDTNPNNWSILNIIYDGTSGSQQYYGSVVTETSSPIPNSDLANSNVVINGVTIDLGSSGTITTNTDLTAFSVTTNSPSGNGSLAYSNTTGVFTFTPANVSSGSGGIELTSLSVTTNSPSGNGALSYNNTTGVFSFTPSDVPDSTDELAEGSTNLYFTNARANTVIGTNTTDNLSEGATNLYFTTARANSAITNYTGALTNLTGNVKTTGNLQVNPNTEVDGLKGLTYDSVNNYLGLGTTIPTHALEIVSDNGGNSSEIQMVQYSTSTAGNRLYYQKADGTLADSNHLDSGDHIHQAYYMPWRQVADSTGNASFTSTYGGSFSTFTGVEVDTFADGGELIHTIPVGNLTAQGGSFGDRLKFTDQTIRYNDGTVFVLEGTTNANLTSLNGQAFYVDQGGGSTSRTYDLYYDEARTNPVQVATGTEDFTNGNAKVVGIPPVGIEMIVYRDQLVDNPSSARFSASSIHKIRQSGDIELACSATDDGGTALVTITEANGTIATSGNISGDKVIGNYLYGDGTNISGIGGSVNSFETITVSGGNSVVADSSTDTLTLTASGAITLTADTANDTITIGGSAGTYGDANVEALLSGGTITGNIETSGFFVGDLDGAVVQDVRNETGATLVKGKAVYLTGASTGDNPHVALADADDSAKMPALGIVYSNIANASVGQVATSGVINVASHGFTEGADLFISTTAGDLSETAPTGESAGIQKIGKVVSPNHIIVQGAFRQNATPNLDQDKIFIGNAANRATTVSLTGLTSNIKTTGNLQVNPDTQIAGLKGLTFDSTNNFLGLGTTTPGVLLDGSSQDSALHIFCNDEFHGTITIEESRNSTSGPEINFAKAWDSTGTPSAVGNSNRLGELNYFGYDGTDMLERGALRAYVDYPQQSGFTIDPGNCPVGWEFITSEVGNTTISNSPSVFKIRANGTIQVGSMDATSSNNGVQFQVTSTGAVTTNGNITGNNYFGNGSNLTGIDLFKTISVSGQSDVVADTISDTLTLEAGSGMTITTDAANDKISFASTSSYGNTNVQTWLASGNNAGNIETAGNLIISGSSSNVTQSVSAYFGSNNTGSNDQFQPTVDPGHADSTPITFSGTTNPDITFLNGNVYYTKSLGGGIYEIYTDTGLSSPLQSGTDNEAPSGLQYEYLGTADIVANITGDVNITNQLSVTGLTSLASAGANTEVGGDIVMQAGTSLHVAAFTNIGGGTINAASFRVTDFKANDPLGIQVYANSALSGLGAPFTGSIVYVTGDRNGSEGAPAYYSGSAWKYFSDDANVTI